MPDTDVPEANTSPADPFASLRAALERLNHAATLDFHDRMDAHRVTLNAIAAILLHKE